MRSKEDAHDYRYFPDPDLLPLELKDNFIEKIKSEIPELPDEKKKRFIDKFNLSSYEANILVSDKETSEYFEKVIKNSDVKLKMLILLNLCKWQLILKLTDKLT